MPNSKKKPVAEPNVSCDECVHGALDSGGVYCKLFHEEILNPVTVAADCGEFETEFHGQVNAERVGISLAEYRERKANGVMNGKANKSAKWVSSEQERTVMMEVRVDFFGKEEHGQQHVATVARRLGEIFPHVTVKET